MMFSNELVEMRSLYNNDPYPSVETRKQTLNEIKTVLIQNEQALIESYSKDFGYRSEMDTLLADLIPSLSLLSYLKKKSKILDEC